jgi:hypothetical protein
MGDKFDLETRSYFHHAGIVVAADLARLARPWRNWRVQQLCDKLGTCGFAASGLKRDLIVRLARALDANCR